MQEGMKVSEACEQVGITERVYRDWLHKGDNTIEALRGFLTMAQREQLSKIVTARLQIVDLIIADALDPLTAPKDRVMLERRLDEIAFELQRTHHAVPGIEEDANKFLKEGPVIESKKSRLASIDVERTKDGVTVNVYEEHDVIDITPDLEEEASQLRPRLREK